MTLWCWWCCHPWDGEFLHLPYSVDKVSRKYKTLGNFCSWECMKAYALDKYPCHKSGVMCMYIKSIRKSNTVLRCAPSQKCLKQFGGTITIEEYRSKNNRNVVCIMPENIHHLTRIVEPIEKTVTTPSSSELKNKLDSINNSTGHNEPLKLKRNKPLKRDTENNLEKTLGLFTKKKSPLAVSGS